MKSLVRLLILLALVSISLTSAALTEGEEKFVIEHDAIPYQLIDTESIHEFKDICDTKKKKLFVVRHATMQQELKDSIRKHIPDNYRLRTSEVLLAEISILKKGDIILLTDQKYRERYISKYYKSHYGNDTILKIRTDDKYEFLSASSMYDKYDSIGSNMILISKCFKSNFVTTRKDPKYVTIQCYPKHCVPPTVDYPIFYFIKIDDRFYYLGWGG